jgi:hypothetical protein
MNKYVSSMIQLLETEKYHLALIRYKNDTEKEAEARLEDGKKFVPVPVDGSDTLSLTLNLHNVLTLINVISSICAAIVLIFFIIADHANTYTVA